MFRSLFFTTLAFVGSQASHTNVVDTLLKGIEFV
jgi:hypothetical protein